MPRRKKMSTPGKKFQSDPQRESYDDFPQVTCLECNSRVYKKTNFLRSYLYKYSAKSSEIWSQGSVQLHLKLFFFLLKCHRKKLQRKCHDDLFGVAKPQNPKASIPNVMKPAHKRIEKIDQCLRIQPLRGDNLLYITQMNDSLTIQMTKPPFCIQESKESQYNPADLTIII